MSLYSRHLLPRLMHMTMQASFFEEPRKRTVARARGVVLEIGFGSGLNLPAYDRKRVTRLYALEPEAGMLKLAGDALSRAPFPVEVLNAGAELIPLPDNSVDTVLSTWTLCTIPDLPSALAEVQRVLKPDGQFVFVEHGLSPEHRVAWWQNKLTPAWRRCAGGCHLNRPADVLLRDAGFELVQLDNCYLGQPKPMTYTFEGRAHHSQS